MKVLIIAILLFSYITANAKSIPDNETIQETGYKSINAQDICYKQDKKDNSLKLVHQKLVNPRIKNNHTINLTLGGPTLIASLSYEYYLHGIKNTSFEVGLGISGVYAGGKIYLFGNIPDFHWNLYAGIYGLLVSQENDTFLGLMAPLGINYISDNGFRIAFEIEYSLLEALNFDNNNIIDNKVSGGLTWAGLKIGISLNKNK